MSDALDRSLTRALEEALRADAQSGAPAAPLPSDLGSLVATARRIRRLQVLPAPAGLADQLAARLALELEGPGAAQRTPNAVRPVPTQAPAPVSRQIPRWVLTTSGVVGIALAVWLAMVGRNTTSPASIEGGAATASATVRGIPSPSSTTTALPSLTPAATVSPRPAPAIAAPRLLIPVATAVSPSPTAEPATSRPKRDTPTAESTATRTAGPSTATIRPMDTAIPTPVPSLTPASTRRPSETPRIEPTKPTPLPSETRYPTRTPPVEPSNTPGSEPTPRPTVVDPGRTPTGTP